MPTFYPHLTATGPAPSAREVTETYRTYFYKCVADGSLRPIVLPYHIYGLGLLTAYLCIDHRQRPYLYKARWLVLAVIGWFQWKTLWEASSASLATSYAAGLVSAWGFAWSATWLVFYKPQFTSKRIEFAQGNAENVDPREEKSQCIVPQSDREYNCRIRKDARIRSGQAGNTNGSTGGAVVGPSDGGKVKLVTDGVEEYYWQGYPESLTKGRIPWILDHLVNFRGPGWNWAITTFPSIPCHIEQKLLGLDGRADYRALKEHNRRISRTGIRRFDSRQDLLLYMALWFTAGYLLLDLTKTLMMKDPYFIFGPTTYDPPLYLRSLHPWALIIFHEVTSFCAIILALEMVFMLAPLILSLILGPKILGLRGEAWQYPTQFGYFYSNVSHKGLAGLWGGWWHQFFRSIFTAPMNFLIDNGYVDRKSTLAKFLGLVFAFGISGVLHAAGSITQIPDTQPWHLFYFFALQAVGIALQTNIKILRDGESANLLFTTAWLLSTGWLIADDFARGGIWLLEPVPVSFFRWWLGDAGDSWWCWGHMGVSWYTGRHCWESGIAL
jgi:hypothetical protein